MLYPVEAHKIRRCRGLLQPLVGDLCRDLLAATDKGRYRFRWSSHEKTVMRRRKRIKPSEWAPKHMIIPTGPFEGAKMSLSITPHLAGMLDAAVMPYVREVNVCAAPQGAKTTYSLTLNAWFSIFEPGPTLSVYPDEKTGTENMVERIRKAYQLSPQLQGLMTGRKEDISKHSLRLKTMYHRIGWSGSITSLANRSIKLLNLDEVDKYQDRPDKSEAGTIDLAKIRCRTFGNHKILMLSSTSVDDGAIWTSISKETEALFTLWVNCPHCTTPQVMSFSEDTFWWPHGDDGHSLDRMTILSRKLARYVCPHCGVMWDDDQRNQAVQQCCWRLLVGDPLEEDSYLEQGEELFRHLQTKRPRSIGFIVPSWISRFVSLSEVAHDFLKSQDRKSLSPEERFMAYQNFQNKHRSLPWRYELESRPVESILALCDDRPAGVVPGGNQVACLMAGVDTQDDGFYLSIWAVGWGMQRDMWLVRYEFVDSFAALATTLWNSEYFDVDGKSWGVDSVFIDQQGHRQSEVLDFCIQYEGLIRPVFGSSYAMIDPYAPGKKEFYPNSDKPIPLGVRALKINTKWFKDRLVVKLNVEPGLPGSIRLHANTSEDFCNQLISEARDEKGVWMPIKHRANHYWDTLVYVSAAFDKRGIQHMPQPKKQDDQQEAESPTLGVVSVL